MASQSEAPEAPRKRSKEGHFLSSAEKRVLDAGPDPFASLDAQRRSEKKEERRAHQKRFHQVLGQVVHRARAALTDLWWLTHTLDADFARKVHMQEVRSGVTALEFVVFEATRRLGWERVPIEAGGSGEFYAERIAKVIGDALTTPGRQVRVEIVLTGVEGPLSFTAVGERKRA